MKDIRPQEFYSWMSAITVFIFIETTPRLEGEHTAVTDYVIVAAALALVLVALYKSTQAIAQAKHKESST